MPEDPTFRIGSSVACQDGGCGDLRRLVVDPVAGAVTHLVVEPVHRRFGGHLVPTKFVQAAGDHEVHLSLTLAEFERLDQADDLHFLPGRPGYGYEPQDVMLAPHFAAGIGVAGAAALNPIGPSLIAGPDRITHPDRVPPEEIEVKRGDQMSAVDGPIGQIKGFVIDPADDKATHVLVEEGHLWGKREIAIPIGSVKLVDGEVKTDLSKDQIEALPDAQLR